MAIAKKKTTAKKPAAKKTTAKRTVAKKPAAKKTTAKKTVAKKPAAKKTTAKKNNPFLSPLVRNGEAAIVF
ncbi:MAG: histone H1-like repetitive region-containing protein [Proteobacteria bacterium]|nr:histone H1-like repetitive region-containing protein [Pseudomonadota bacterium]